MDRSRVHHAPVTDVVFCGPGMGGAVAQLLALFVRLQQQSGRDKESVAPSVVTFGSPSVGDAAFQEHMHCLTRHTRLYVEHDLIAGLPSSTCVGRRFFSGIAPFAKTLAQEH